MRNPLRLCVLSTVLCTGLLCTPLARAQDADPRLGVRLLTAAAPTEELQANFYLDCPTGVDEALTVSVSPDSEPVLLESFSLSAEPSKTVDVISPQLADDMCGRLRERPGYEGEIPGSKEARIRLRLDYSGQCRGEVSRRQSAYLLTFTLLCTDVSKIHAPSGADPGPAGDGFAPQSLEMEAVSIDGLDGGGVGYQQGFGDRARHLLRVAAGIREISPTLSVGTVGLLGAAGPSGAASSAGFDIVPLEAEVQLIPVDVSYGFHLVPPDRRVVPTLYAGVGWTFSEVESPDFEGREAEVFAQTLRAPFAGFEDDGFTLHAGFSLRFHLDRYGRGKYLYAGVRSRWYERRELDETDEEVFFGLGLPVCPGGKR